MGLWEDGREVGLGNKSNFKHLKFECLLDRYVRKPRKPLER